MNQIKEILDSPQGKALKSLLIKRCEELKSIENIQEKGTAAEQTIEIKAQRRAYLKLKSILEEIQSYEVEEIEPEDYY